MSSESNQPQHNYSNRSDESNDNENTGESGHQAVLPAAIGYSLYHPLSQSSTCRTTRTAATMLHGTDEPIYVTDLGPNDVLLGRGRSSVDFDGNVQFRAIINVRLHEYTDRGQKRVKERVKDDVAKSVVELIERLGGRFLKRVETATEATTVSKSASESSSCKEKSDNTGRKPPANVNQASNNRLYQVAEYDVAIEKVKQTFRDMIHAKRKQGDNVHCENTDSATVTMDRTVDDAAVLMVRQQHNRQICDLNIPSRSLMTDVHVNSNVVSADRMAVAAGINFHPNISAAVGNNNTNNNFGIMNSSYALTHDQQLPLLSSIQVQQLLANDGISVLNQQYRLQQQQQQQQRQCLDDIALLLQLHRRINTYPSQQSISELLVGCIGTNGQTMQDTLRIRQEEALLATLPALQQQQPWDMPLVRGSSSRHVSSDVPIHQSRPEPMNVDSSICVVERSSSSSSSSVLLTNATSHGGEEASSSRHRRTKSKSTTKRQKT
jgi:hypothetical protein